MRSPGSKPSAIADLGRGAGAVGSALAFVLTSEGGLRTALAPAATAVGAWIVLGAAATWGLLAASDALFPRDGMARLLFGLLAGAIAVLVSGLLALAIAQPLSRAALDRLASRLTRSLGAPEPPMRSSHLLASLQTALGAIGFGLPSIGLLELLTVFAPEAAPITEALAFVAAGLSFTWGLFDYPMSRRGMTWRARVRWMASNMSLCLGFAVAAQVLLLVPVLDLFALPIGVLGATKLLATRGPVETAPRRRLT